MSKIITPDFSDYQIQLNCFKILAQVLEFHKKKWMYIRIQTEQPDQWQISMSYAVVFDFQIFPTWEY